MKETVLTVSGHSSNSRRRSNPSPRMVQYPPSSDLPQYSAPVPSQDDNDTDNDFDTQMSLANTALNSGRGRDKSSSHPFRSLTPKRIAIIATVLLLIVWLFGKGTGSRSGYGFNSGSNDLEQLDGDDATGDEILTPISEEEAESDEVENIPLDRIPDDSPQKQSGKVGSGKCTPPPGKKPLTYALMIDAGSTGSRLHLYTFSHCDPDPNALPKLESEGFFMTKPGLSSYDGRPEEAAESLRVLMDEAIIGVPKNERGCTPVAVKATAGLRLLGQQKSDEILDEVERWLKEEWPFSVVQDGVVVMEGRDEGVPRLYPH